MHRCLIEWLALHNWSLQHHVSAHKHSIQVKAQDNVWEQYGWKYGRVGGGPAYYGDVIIATDLSKGDETLKYISKPYTTKHTPM
jgi:hypothetical protein